MSTCYSAKKSNEYLFFLYVVTQLANKLVYHYKIIIDKQNEKKKIFE